MLQLFKQTAQQLGKDYNYADKTHFSNGNRSGKFSPE